MPEIEQCDVGLIPNRQSVFTELNTPTRIFEYLAIGKPEAAPYGGAWNGPILVLTHHPPATSQDPAITFISDDIGAAVAAAVGAAGGRNVVVFGANVARQCIDAGLLDEILVHVAPVLLGDGVRVFESPGAGRAIDLERISVEEWGQVTTLRFRVPT